MGISQHLEDEVPHNVRAWKPANVCAEIILSLVCVYGPIICCEMYFSCARAAARRKAAAALTLSVPVLCWRNHESYFPTIAKLARKYLCIPALAKESF